MPTHTHDLALAGRILIWSMRHWLRARARGVDVPRFVLHTLAQLPQGAAIREACEALFAHLLIGAKRRLCVAAPDAGALTLDEAELVWALSACGCGLEQEVRLLLVAHQRGDCLRATAQAVAALAHALECADLNLLRDDRSLRSDLAFTKQSSVHGSSIRA